MKKDILWLFNKLPELVPPNGLERRILVALAKHRMRAARILFAGNVAAAGIAGAMLGFATKQLLADLAQSGFLSYARLAFSDIGTIGVVWKSFALTVAESVPSLSLALALISLCGVGYFALRALTYLGDAFTSMRGAYAPR